MNIVFGSKRFQLSCARATLPSARAVNRVLICVQGDSCIGTTPEPHVQMNGSTSNWMNTRTSDDLTFQSRMASDTNKGRMPKILEQRMSAFFTR